MTNKTFSAREVDRIVYHSSVLKEAVNILTRDICGEPDIKAIEVAIDYWEYVSIMLKERLEEIRERGRSK